MLTLVIQDGSLRVKIKIIFACVKNADKLEHIFNSFARFYPYVIMD